MSLRTYHFQLDVESAVLKARTDLKYLKGWLIRDDGVPLSPKAALKALELELNRGHKYIPIGNCPEFDPDTGCPGHMKHGH